jgi:hypothetical protein
MLREISSPKGREGARGNRGFPLGLGEALRLEQWTSQCAVKNCEFPITVYLAADVFERLDKEGLPENVTVLEGMPNF